MRLTFKDYRGLESLLKFHEKDIEKSLEEYTIFLDALMVLQQYIVENKVKLPAYKTYLDTLITKSILHCNTLMYNLKGVPVESKSLKLKAKILDIPSLHIMVRAQLETFLMMDFIYFQPEEEAEIEFRYKNWIYAGLLKRKSIPAKDTESIKTQQNDKLELKELEAFIKSSPYFKKHTKKQRKEIIEKGNERLFNSWVKLMNDSGFSNKYSYGLYSLLSSSAHATGLSLINLKGTKLGYYKNNEHAHLMLTLSNLMLCRLIFQFKSKIKAVEIKYNMLSKNITDRIEFYSLALTKKS